MDNFLDMIFESNRWDDAIHKGLKKGIDISILEPLCIERTRNDLKQKIANYEYHITPPHEAQIPKDNGDFRTVYVNEGQDRVLLSIINDAIFETCSDMIHPNCKSYLKGIGCGKVVQNISSKLTDIKSDIFGVKVDLTKYFDSVPIEIIDTIFSQIEQHVGASSILDLMTEYYHMNTVLDINRKPINKYTSLRQGCAVAAFLADASLYPIDKVISSYDVLYVRYSDDILIIGKDWKKAYDVLKQRLDEIGLTLNPKKVELLKKHVWFKFLGFELCDNKISLSASRIKSFQKEIENRTIKSKDTNIDNIIHNVETYLYTGPDNYCWATSVLPIINQTSDIIILNGFVMDAIRATITHKTAIGDLYGNPLSQNGYINRSRGRYVTANKRKIPLLRNYITIQCMQNAMATSKQAFNMLVQTI